MEADSFLTWQIAIAGVIILGQIVFYVFPAYRQAKIAEASAELAKCLREFEERASAVERESGKKPPQDFFTRLFLFFLSKDNALTRRNLKDGSSKRQKKILKDLEAALERLEEKDFPLLMRATFATEKLLKWKQPLYYWLLLNPRGFNRPRTNSLKGKGGANDIRSIILTLQEAC